MSDKRDQTPGREDGESPYSGSGNRYANSYKKKEPEFQFPWWAIVLGFVMWWPLGVAGIIINSVLRKSAANSPTRHPYAESGARYAANSAPNAGTAGKTAKKPGASGQEDSQGLITTLLIVGICLAAIGGLATATSLSDVVMWLSMGHVAWALEDISAGLMFLGGGLGCCYASHRLRTSWRMRRKIKNLVGKADSMYIEDIAAAIPCSYEKCCGYLENCIEKGVFGDEAYLDMRSRSLVVRGAAPAIKTPPAPAPKTEERPAPKENDHYQKILDELREVNRRIPGEEMSDKITRLEQVSAKIFHQAEASPQKLPQMRKFMDYYLPTALKLLKTYAELDAQGIEGENIRDSKRRIEQAMDTLVVAFEHQLDQLFEGDALDISTDIDVMENMLAADGLTRNNDPFKLYERPSSGPEDRNAGAEN